MKTAKQRPARKSEQYPAKALEFIPPPGSEATQPSPLDRHFAELMEQLHGAPAPELKLAAQLVSAWRGAGHICLPLESLGVPDLVEKLRASRVVGAPGEPKPLILDSAKRLYLQRYWAYQNSLARALEKRLKPAEHDSALLATGLARFFRADQNVAEQRRAASTAIEKNFCVITGGPGTGKTRTVVVILALLLEQFAARGKTARIALAAPTGKAAARLKESIQKAAGELDLPETIRASMPADATTLHRLLGYIPDSAAFRHDAERPLAVDAMIVDEASMVDLALMAKLFAAIPPEARVILLGDKDQLSSVEAGAVLGDICHPPADAVPAPIRGHIVELATNFRFQPDSGIHRLSTLVNAGQSDYALALLNAGSHRDLAAVSSPAPRALPGALCSRVLEGFSNYLATDDPREALARFSRFRILCALRRGPFGVENLNRLAEEALAEAGLIDPAGPFYRGRPIVILRNDYQLKLFNGDVGLLLADAEAGGELRAFFLAADGELRRLAPARLPGHETVFAMTVHKSQGSEFDRVLLVLPDRDSPVVTRELVYTGITRARSRVEIWFRDPILRAAIARRTQRTSGLRDALWKR